jgi:RNA polymerase sigma-70 factor (ECF subfamily)
MDQPQAELHLSQIETHWTEISQAHRGQADAAAVARAELVGRYVGAVHRYLVAATGDVETASDLTQEFALRILRGDFQSADPARGRFRDFLKRSVRNLMLEHYRRCRARSMNRLEDAPEPAGEDGDLADFDQQFLARWREELLAHAWDALARAQRSGGVAYYTVLRLRADRPELRSQELALHLASLWGRPVTACWVRQTLLRARQKFAEAVIRAVTDSLPSATPDQVQQELSDLCLLEYCRPFFA